MKKKLIRIGIIVTLIVLAGWRLYKDYDKIKYVFNERSKALQQIERGKKIQKIQMLCFYISRMAKTEWPVSYAIDTTFRGKEPTGNISFTIRLSNRVFNDSTVHDVEEINKSIARYCMWKVIEIDRTFFKNICTVYIDSYRKEKSYCSEKKN